MRTTKVNPDKQLKRTPKHNDKNQSIKNLHKSIKSLLIHPIFQKNYNKAKDKFMISTATTTKEDDIYWVTSNNMTNLQLITKSVCVLSVSDNSKNINQNQWNNCIISDMGYHSATKSIFLKKTEYFILLRFLDNYHWVLFYGRNDNRTFFSTKEKTKNRLYHKIMKFCDPRTRFILIGDQKHIENEICKSFYYLPEKSDYFDFPPSYQTWCTTSLYKREKCYNIKNIKWG